MDLVSLYWIGPTDVHLMRDKSGPMVLENRLWVKSKSTPTATVQNQDLAAFLAAIHHDHPNAQCTFKPTFKATFNPTTHEYEGFGVTVNADTGSVHAGLNTGAQPFFNFTVVATLVVDRNDPGSSRKKAYVRFHLHKFVAKAWLAPFHLRVPRNIPEFRFSLYAQFDDKTIAELPLDLITWNSDRPDKVSDSGYLSFDDTDADDSLVEVVGLLPDQFQDESGAGVSAMGFAIPYTLPHVAQLIPNSAGYELRDQVPNFLFLADGFMDADGDEAKFDSIIDRFLTSLRQEGTFKPFDQLVGRMNFWKAFVPSASRGIGTRYEVYGADRASVVPEFSETFNIINDSPTSVSELFEGQWGPNQVRYYFGLPLSIHTEMPNNLIRAYWGQISHLPIGLINVVSDDLVNEWKAMGDRRYVNDSDTFLGTFHGARTRAQVVAGQDASDYQLNYSRFDRSRLNNFLIALQYKDENGVLQPIGPVWDIATAASGGKPAGKDYDNVIILLCADSGRSLNQRGNLFVNVISEEHDDFGIEPDSAVNNGFADGRAVKLKNLASQQLPVDLPLMPGKTSLLHEIAHSLGLDDEYGEIGIEKESFYFQFSGIGDIETDKYSSNIQVKSDLTVSATVDDIDADKVKWRWHRIAASGVLAPLAPPAPAAMTLNGIQYTIKLKPGQADFFAEGESAFLRRRILAESILTDIEYYQVSAPRYPFVTRSPELVIRLVNTFTHEVVVEARTLGALAGHDLVVDFPAESVLYMPQDSRTGNVEDPGFPFLELTAANILRHMDSHGRPLHEKMDGDGHPALDFDSEQVPELVDITIAMCAKKNRNLVGLYAGGNQYHHGVYHPTGHCIMRSGRQLAAFCSVCKYIITDYIDPSLHPYVDKLIEEYYPLKANP